MSTRWSWEVTPKVTETIHDLWHNAVEYFKWCDLNPIRSKKTILAGKEAGRKVEVEFQRPYLLKELCLHCGVTEEYIKDLLRAPRDSEAYLVIGRIVMNIQVQIAALALVGEISPVLADKMINFAKNDDGPQKVIIEHVGDLPKLGNSEIEILENINIQNGEIKISKGKEGETGA